MREVWAKRTLYLAAAALVFVVGYRSVRGHVPQPVPQVEAEVVAMVGNTPITEADVEAVSPSEFLSLRRELNDLRVRALDAAIHNLLLEMEAEARGVEPSALVQREVDLHVEEPSEEEVSAFFREQQLQGSLEEIAPQIRSYLRNQARNTQLAAFLAGLEEKYSVRRFLDPVRVEVATEGFPSKGPGNAPVTIVEFSDFQCPYCRVMQEPLEQVVESYGNRVRFVFRQFPLVSIHPQAAKAAEASLCAYDQGKFWEMHDAMFANQRALQVDQLKATAATLGLDGGEFDECLDSGRYAQEVSADLAAGQALGIRGTPMIFINGRALSGAKPFEEIAEVIEDELVRAGR